MTGEPESLDEVVADMADRPLAEEQRDEAFGRLDAAADGIHRRAGTRPATAAEVTEFHDRYGPFGSDDEG